MSKPRLVSINESAYKLYLKVKAADQKKKLLEKYVKAGKQELEDLLKEKPGDLIYQDRLIASLIEFPKGGLNQGKLEEKFPDAFNACYETKLVQRFDLK